MIGIGVSLSPEALKPSPKPAPAGAAAGSPPPSAGAKGDAFVQASKPPVTLQPPAPPPPPPPPANKAAAEQKDFNNLANTARDNAQALAKRFGGPGTYKLSDREEVTITRDKDTLTVRETLKQKGLGDVTRQTVVRGDDVALTVGDQFGLRRVGNTLDVTFGTPGSAISQARYQTDASGNVQKTQNGSPEVQAFGGDRLRALSSLGNADAPGKGRGGGPDVTDALTNPLNFVQFSFGPAATEALASSALAGVTVGNSFGIALALPGPIGIAVALASVFLPDLLASRSKTTSSNLGDGQKLTTRFDVGDGEIRNFRLTTVAQDDDAGRVTRHIDFFPRDSGGKKANAKDVADLIANGDPRRMFEQKVTRTGKRFQIDTTYYDVQSGSPFVRIREQSDDIRKGKLGTEKSVNEGGTKRQIELLGEDGKVFQRYQFENGKRPVLQNLDAEGRVQSEELPKRSTDFFELIDDLVNTRPDPSKARKDDVRFDGALVGADGRTFAPSADWSSVPAVQPRQGATTNEIGIYVNGINTTKDDQAASLQNLADRTGQPLIGVHNATAGFTRDLAQAGLDLNRIGNNEAVTSLTGLVLGKLDSGQPVHLYAHSQGGAITGRSLFEVRDQLLQRGLSLQEAEAKLANVKVETFGAAIAGFPDGPQYVHYVNVSDPVPALVGVQTSGTLLPLNVLTPLGEGARVIEFIDLRPNPIDSHGFDDVYIRRRLPFDEARATGQ